MNRIGRPPRTYDHDWLTQFAAETEQRLRELEQPVPTRFYVQNRTDTATIDATTATTAEVAHLLGTLIEALRKRGIVR